MFFSGIFRSISTIIFFTACMLQTFPFCYLCDLIVEDGRKLSNLLAQSHWIDAEPRFKSTLRIFLLHLQEPIIFIAGGMFPICIESNIQVKILRVPANLLELNKVFFAGCQDCFQCYNHCGKLELGRKEISYLVNA